MSGEGGGISNVPGPDGLGSPKTAVGQKASGTMPPIYKGKETQPERPGAVERGRSSPDGDAASRRRRQNSATGGNSGVVREWEADVLGALAGSGDKTSTLTPRYREYRLRMVEMHAEHKARTADAD